MSDTRDNDFELIFKYYNLELSEEDMVSFEKRAVEDASFAEKNTQTLLRDHLTSRQDYPYVCYQTYGNRHQK